MKAIGIPTEAASIYNKALALSNMGNYDLAIEQYMRAVEVFPQFIEAYNNIGELYSRMGNSEKAIQVYSKALSIKKNHKVLLNLGVEYYNAADYTIALQYFNESLLLKKDFLEGNFYTGMTYFNLKNYVSAKKYFEATVAIDAHHLKANYLLAYILYEDKEYLKVIECLKRIEHIADDLMFINRYYGFCYYHLGDYKKAVKFLSAALTNSPKYAQFKAYLESLTYENKLKEIGDIDATIQALERKIMAEKPNLSEYTRLSMLYIFKGQYKKAEDLLVGVKSKIAR
ncbi:MAG TPA: tetratricopeptide repeat protein [Spirochaetota bacterium]|nr:tetratricopeptide repeat protein [Spirochaetota bacterium]HOM87270.1 tetratricopeptide repeat protein [Spirochaetota bacterium]HOR94391.1 tetratricopeptide repeat protein [Spirochaetota bacterium]HOT20744.1 tetratricopeptide repeat protein [Spirochaetota bacterium]HPD03964.1 tetratricopeptide repeat protein [Spirochaetota bacterium]